MKKIILAACVLIYMSSCGENKPASTPETATQQEAVPEQPATTVAATAAIKDPVCDMEKDASWTEYSANGTDTTWFCSAACKKAFEGNPAKYTH